MKQLKLLKNFKLIFSQHFHVPEASISFFVYFFLFVFVLFFFGKVFAAPCQSLKCLSQQPPA